MRREDISDITSFAIVAQEGSFTKAASKIGITQSALSQIVRRLEDRLGVRLLARTTRSVAPTLAGERLMSRFLPLLQELESGIAELGEYRDKPAGHIRLTAVEHAAKTIILPKLSQMLPEYPDISVEVIVDYNLSDVVSDRFDAGVRLGEHVEQDMIALRISPDIPMAIVGSPRYLDANGRPTVPEELSRHRGINLRLPTSNTVNTWRLQSTKRETRVKIDGQLILNSIELIQDAALNGMGLAYLPLDQVEPLVSSGSLELVLNRWTTPLPGYHLFYPNRRQNLPAFKLVADALRYRHKEPG